MTNPSRAIRKPSTTHAAGLGSRNGRMWIMPPNGWRKLPNTRQSKPVLPPGAGGPLPPSHVIADHQPIAAPCRVQSCVDRAGRHGSRAETTSETACAGPGNRGTATPSAGLQPDRSARTASPPPCDTGSACFGADNTPSTRGPCFATLYWCLCHARIQLLAGMQCVRLPVTIAMSARRHRHR